MKKFKLYIDKDKEEEWLNEFSKKGWAMKKFFLGLYTFERSEENYTYRIDLLKNWEGDKKDYVEFMEDSGVEYVAQWYRWVFLRKKASQGSFELYSDKESLIDQYSRIKKFFFFGFIIEIICALLQLPSVILSLSIVNTICLMIMLAFAIALLGGIHSSSKKIKKLMSL